MTGRSTLPKGRTVLIQGMSFLEIRDGKVVHEKDFYDPGPLRVPGSKRQTRREQ